MTPPAVTPRRHSRDFAGVDGLRLVADEWGHASDEAGTVVLLHGGGQTRHSWKSAGVVLAKAGLHVVALDFRGHGDSDWSPELNYGLGVLRDDVLAVIDQIEQAGVGAQGRAREPGRVVLVGASLGGMTSLLVAQAAPERIRSLVLVDIVTRLEPAGVARIRDFMLGAPDGFGTLQEAAEAVAAYLPHRRRDTNLAGLRKNLRLRADGRWHWHWDPAQFWSERSPSADEVVAMLVAAAAAVHCPTLLVHGRKSDIVSDEGIEHFRTLLDHVEIVRLDDAAHTAAADDNDTFAEVVVEFCLRG